MKLSLNNMAEKVIIEPKTKYKELLTQYIRVLGHLNGLQKEIEKVTKLGIHLEGKLEAIRETCEIDHEAMLVEAKKEEEAKKSARERPIEPVVVEPKVVVGPTVEVKE